MPLSGTPDGMKGLQVLTLYDTLSLVAEAAAGTSHFKRLEPSIALRVLVSFQGLYPDDVAQTSGACAEVHAMSEALP